MFHGTITLFNRRRGVGLGAGDVWYPTVIHGVQFMVGEAALAARYGQKRDDRALMLIQTGGERDAPTVGGKPYLPPKLWQAEEDHAKAVTFQAGEAFDFFTMWAWEGGTTPVNDSDYKTGFYDHLNKTRDGVYAVTDVARYTLIPHFEVTGK